MNRTKTKAHPNDARVVAIKSFTAIFNSATETYRPHEPRDGFCRTLPVNERAENIPRGYIAFGYNGIVRDFPEMFRVEDNA